MKKRLILCLALLAITNDGTKNAETLFQYRDIPIGQQIKIGLEEGNVLIIARANFRIAPYDHSWKP